MATSSEHLGPLTHTLLGVTAPRHTHTTQQGKVAGGKAFTGSNFGIEIAGKQKGTTSGLESWLLGLQAPPGSEGLRPAWLCSL